MIEGGDEDPRLANVGEENRPETANIEIFGPKGLREYVRHTLRLTYTHLGGWISVHELLFPHDEETSNAPDVCYEKEIPGRNFRQDTSGFWRDIVQSEEYSISAGEIKHSVPSMGFVFTEASIPGKIPKEYPQILSSHKEYFRAQGIPNPMVLLSALQSKQTTTKKPAAAIFPSTILTERGIHLPDNSVLPPISPRPGRKITILGDTYDPSQIVPLAQNSTVLVHEATNAHLPGIDPATKPTDTYTSVKERTMSRGHSTPEMAGLFARVINLGMTEDGNEVPATLILNHFSARYKDDEADGPDGEAKKIMDSIMHCANNAWCKGIEGSGLEGFEGTTSASTSDKRRVICARDGIKVEIKASE